MPNTPPTLTGLAASLSVASTHGPTLLDADVTFTDLDANLTGGALRVSGLSAGDVVSVRNQGSGAGQIGFNSGTGQVSYEGVVIGVLQGGVGAGGSLKITFNASATAAGVEALIENLTFDTASGTATGSRTLQVTVTDAAGAMVNGPQTPTYVEKTQFDAGYPFNPINVGTYAAPTFGDLDGDGDLDLVLGDDDGFLLAYRNAGTGFTPMTGGDNPFNGVDVGQFSTPSFGDVDGDGDADLVVGHINGGVRYWLNTGSGFTEQIGAANPFNLVDTGTVSGPGLVDFDFDGDMDLIAGDDDGFLRAWQNTAGSFAALVGAGNPFNGIDFGSRSAPAFGDIDGDGDKDAVVSHLLGTIRTFENTGAGFTELVGANNPFNGVDVGTSARPSLADVDGDGDADLAVGEHFGVIKYYLNTTAHPSMTVNVTANVAPALTGLRPAVTFAENLVNATPQLLDTQVGLSDANNNFNGGSLTVSGLMAGDVVSVRNQGAGGGQIGFNSGTGVVSFGGTAIGTAAGGAGANLVITLNASATTAGVDALIQNLTYASVSDAPAASRTLTIAVADSFGSTNAFVPSTMVEQDFGSTPFVNSFMGGDLMASFGDVDLDGDLDAVFGQDDGTFSYLRNIGTATNPNYDQPFGFNPFHSVDVGYNAAPALADLDGDGDIDALVSDYYGTVRFFRNTGVQQWVQQSGANNPFDGMDLGTQVAPVVADIDGDGRKDVVFGDENGELRYFRNTGSLSVAAFTEQTGAANPFDDIDVGYASTPSFADMDQDGDLDLVVGEEDGNFNFYRNTGSASQPVYVLQSGANDPFDGLNAGANSKPSFADLDADGDPDAFIGHDGFNYFYYKNVAQQTDIVVNVTAQNDGPTLSGVAPLVQFAENAVGGSGQVLDSDVTFVDADGASGRLHITGMLAEDRISIQNQGLGAGQIGFDSESCEIFYGGVLIGFATTGVGGGPLFTVEFEPAATQAAIDALIQNLTYANVSGSPTFTRTLRLNLLDEAGAAANGPFTPAFSLVAGGSNPFNGIDVSRSDPAFTDFDADGDQDLVLGQETGGIKAYRNDGGTFTEQTTTANPFNDIVLSEPFGRTLGSPTFADVNNDGQEDMVLGQSDGELRYFQRSGAFYSEVTGALNPFDAIAASYGSMPAVGDVDGDGDLDLVLGNYYGSATLYRNTGSGYVGEYGTFFTGYGGLNSFALGDIDGDGDLDAVGGDRYGALFTFRNDAGAFTYLSGGSNPFNGVDMGAHAAPAFGDVDGDGDLDLVVGESDGTLNYFINNQPPSASIVVEVVEVNSPPAGTDATLTMLEDATRVLAAADFGYSDTEGDTFLSVIVTTLPGAGALKLNNVAVTAGQTVTKADIDSGLLTFAPAANANGTGYASFTFQVKDDGGTALGGVDTDQSPNTLTFNVTPVNDAPGGANKTVVVVEDGSHTFATSEFGFTDPLDGHALLAVVISTLPPNGSLKLNGVAVTAGQAVSAADIAAGLLVYSPALNGNGLAHGTFTFQVRDDGGTANGGLNTDAVPNFLHVNVTAVNDAPSLTGFGPSVTFNENTVNAAPQLLDTAVVFTDPDDNFDGGTLTLSGLLAQDTASIRNQGSAAGEIGFSAGTVSYGGVAIGAATGGAGSTLTVTFNANATSAAIDALIQNLTYANASHSPTASRILTLTVTDAAGATNPGPMSFGASQAGPPGAGFAGAPAFGDLDGDGDIDMVVGTGGGTITYYQNTGTASSPNLVRTLPLGSGPFSGGDVGYSATPTLADIDGDGDLDAFVGDTAGLIHYFRNTGTPSSATMVEQTGGANPLNGIDVGDSATPTAADLDDDGDFDVMVGRFDGAISYYLNTGSATAPVYVLQTGGANPFNGIDVGDVSAPRVVDLDRDGDLDLVVGTFLGPLSYYENTGSAAAPTFVLRTGADNPFTGISHPFYGKIDLADLDNDGDADLMYGDNNGSLFYHPNTTGPGAPITVTVTAQNDAPTGTDATFTINEDAARVMAAADFGFGDVDGNSLAAVKITTLPTAGALKLNNVAVTAGQSVSVADINAGLLVFTPAANANGTGYASLTFQVQDNGGTANSGVDLDPTANTLTFDVTAVNDAPSGADKTVSVAEDGSHVFAAADFGFSDAIDGHALAAVKISSLPAAGSLRLNGVAVSLNQFVSVADINAGLLVFTPAANANGTGYASFGFQVQDNGGVANGGVDLDPSANTITVNVTPVNDAPAGTDNTVGAVEDTEYVFAIADFGFTDPLDSGDALAKVKINTLPATGFLSLDGSGVTAGQEITVADITGGLLTYFAGPNANGAAFSSFTFQVSDGTDFDPTPNTLTIDVAAVNDAPTGADKTVTIPEDTAFIFGAADFGFSDPVEGDDFAAVTITTLPAGSLQLDGVAVTAGQSISVADLAAGLLVFTPAANVNGAGADSFTFQVQDDGGTANGGENLDPFADTFTFDITAVNDAPSGANKTVTALEDGAVVFAAADFGFSDTLDGDTLAAVTIATLPAAGALTLNGSAVTAGQSISVADINAGLLVFTPAANANGTAYASFTFQVQDNGGTANGGINLDQSPNTITVDVTAVNDAPSGADKTLSLLEDASHTFVAADFGFSDAADGNALAAVKIAALPGAGSLRLNGVAVTAGQAVSAADITAGLLVFTPAANANGTGYASFTFQVQDNGGTANSGIDTDPSANTITVNVTPVNDAPSGADKTVTAPEDGSYTFATADFGFTDTLDGHALSKIKITVQQGDASLRLNGTLVSDGQLIDAADIAAGLLVYTPTANANGAGLASFGFQVQDDGGTANGGVDLDPSANTITLNVTSVNDAPSGADKTVTMLEDGAHTFAAADFGFTDTLDGNALAAVKITTVPGGGALRLNGVVVTAGQSVSAADIAAGLLVYTPTANANGAAHASFTFQVQDNGGTTNGGVDLDQSPNTITLSVTSVNDAPSGANNTVSMLEDGSHTFAAADFGFSDAADGNALAAVRIATLPGAGSLRLNGVAVTAGQSVSAADITAGLLVFTPAANGNGAAYASFTFQVQDNGGTANGGVDLDQSPNTVTLAVTAVNDAPSGADKTVTMLEDASYAFTAADFGFSDALDGNALAAVKIGALPANGALRLNGVAVTAGQSVSVADINAGLLVFSPAANANGAAYANFTFQVQDSGGVANGGVDLDPSANTITLNVTSVNDAPSGADKTITSNEDATFTFAVADFGFSDAADGNALQAVRISALPAAGSLRLNGVNVSVGDFITVADITAGKLKYTPGPNANGDGYSSFGFQVRDNGGTANGGVNQDPTPNTITFNITPANDAPTLAGLAATKTVAENAAAQVLDGNVTVGDVEGNFDGGSVTVTQLLAEDIASIRHQGGGAGQIGYNALTGAVSYEGTAIGMAEGGDGDDLVITLNASATAAAVEALVENLTYENESDAPTLARNLRISVLDAAAAVASGLIAVNITPVNDAPVITAPSSYAANVGVKRALGGISFADADAGAAQVTATLAVTAGTLTANASGGVAVTGAGTANMTLSGTLAALNAFMAAEKVSFTSDGSGNDPLLTLTINDGGASGGPAESDQVVIAISVADNRTGTNGKDVLIGLAEDSHIDGLGGNDTLSGGGGNDTLLGGAGNDVLNGGIGDDSIDGGADTDTASYDGAASGVTVSLAAAGAQNTGAAGLDTLVNVENLLGSDFADVLTGDGAANVLTGGTGADTLNGLGGDDQIIGGDGIDVIDGGADADVIYGRGEADVLTGGAGADRFAFQLLSDSRKADPDLITDLAAEDFVDIRAIDANSAKDGNQAFQIVAAFTNKAAQAVLSYDAGLDQTSLQLDVDADGRSDMTIVFAGDQRGFTGFVL